MTANSAINTPSSRQSQSPAPPSTNKSGRRATDINNKEVATVGIKWDTVLTSLLIALVLGVFSFITNTQTKLQKSIDASAQAITNLVVNEKLSAERIRQMQASLKVIKEATADRYTRGDAKADHADIIGSITAIDDRLRKVERVTDRYQTSINPR